MSPRLTAYDRMRSTKERILKAHPELLPQLDALEAYVREVEDQVIADALRKSAGDDAFSLGARLSPEDLEAVANEVENFRR